MDNGYRGGIFQAEEQQTLLGAGMFVGTFKYQEA